ncbi:hypothetical protein ABW20_dc0108969 [Dactylellina cionopaga]|nr:hypothetical protein ABW20_dc0108969 [Dactylellina cionopaga]
MSSITPDKKDVESTTDSGFTVLTPLTSEGEKKSITSVGNTSNTSDTGLLPALPGGEDKELEENIVGVCSPFTPPPASAFKTLDTYISGVADTVRGLVIKGSTSEEDAGSIDKHASEEVKAKIFEAKNGEIKNDEIKTCHSKNNVKTDDDKIDEAKVDEVKPGDGKTDDVKANDIRSDYVKVDDIKISEADKAEEMKTNEGKLGTSNLSGHDNNHDNAKEDRLLASPPGECCIKYTPHHCKPEGETVKLNGLEVYIVRPAENVKKNGKGIMYFVDAFGLYENAKVIADHLARKGYFVCMPDLTDNDHLQSLEMDQLIQWLGRHEDAVVDHRIEAALNYMHSVEKINRFGAVGYCFGGRHLLRYMKGKEPRDIKIDVGFIAHPSFVMRSDFENIAGPISIAAAQNDTIFPEESRYEAEKTLKNTNLTRPFQITVYSQTSHGFAAKSDLENPSNRYAYQEALGQATRWFDHWL